MKEKNFRKLPLGLFHQEQDMGQKEIPAFGSPEQSPMLPSPHHAEQRPKPGLQWGGSRDRKGE